MTTALTVLVLIIDVVGHHVVREVRWWLAIRRTQRALDAAYARLYDSGARLEAHVGKFSSRH